MRPIRTLSLRGLSALPLLVLVSAMPCRGQAGAEVGPGSALVRTERLRERTDTFDVLFGPARVRGAVNVLHTRFERDGGREVVVRVEEMRGSAGKVLSRDTFTVARRTLAPVSQHSTSGDGEHTLRFDGVRVRGTVREGGGETAVDAKTVAPAFYQNSMDLLLGALPLAEGFEAGIVVFRVETRASERVRARVAGVEAVRTGDGGVCRAWKIEVDEGERAATYWIDEATRTLLAWEPSRPGIRIVRRAGCPALHAA